MRMNVLSSRTPIGLDVGSGQIKAAQLRRLGRRWRAEALCSIPRTAPETSIATDEARSLASVLRRQGFSGKQAVLAVPPEKLLTGIIEVPPVSSGAPVDQIAQMELARLHKVSSDSFEMSYWNLPDSARSGEPAQIMAAACKHDEANKLLDTFEEAGISVEVLDAHPSAVPRACRPLLPDPPGMAGVLDLGWTVASLSIVAQGVVTYERVIPQAGMRELYRTIREQSDLDDEHIDRILTEIAFYPAGQDQQPSESLFREVAGIMRIHFESLCDELQAPFAYVAQRYSAAGVTRVLLIGGGGRIPRLPEFLGTILKTEVIPVKPSDLAECPAHLMDKSADPGLALATGLARFGEE